MGVVGRKRNCFKDEVYVYMGDTYMHMLKKKKKLTLMLRRCSG